MLSAPQRGSQPSHNVMQYDFEHASTCTPSPFQVAGWDFNDHIPVAPIDHLRAMSGGCSLDAFYSPAPSTWIQPWQRACSPLQNKSTISPRSQRDVMAPVCPQGMAWSLGTLCEARGLWALGGSKEKPLSRTSWIPHIQAHPVDNTSKKSLLGSLLTHNAFKNMHAHIHICLYLTTATAILI